ncbi:MAG: MATE family efflux transporter [Verrucomicrobiota bacterium JB025]|nr:MATE family efflux transporter [Verrucomicrobiota bacterium JB025]
MSESGGSNGMDERACEVQLGGKLGGLSLPRQVFVLAIWPLLEQVLAFFVGLTDLLISARMADGMERVAILDAMGVGGYVAWLMAILQGAVATGVMALVSRATGARDDGLANRGLGQGLWLGLAAGIGSMFLLLGAMRFLIGWIGMTPEATVQAEAYLRVLSVSAPFSGALFAVNAALRGSGDTRTPFLAMIVVNVVNMALSWTLVFAPGPVGGHGIDGIAWGSVGGWLAGLAVVVLIVGRGGEGGLHWTRECLRPHGETMRRVVRVGMPQAMEIAGMWSIHAYGAKVISGLGSGGTLGAHILAIRVESLSFLPGFAIATASSALVGQYLGAGSKEMAVKAVRFSWMFAALLMTLAGVFFFFGRYQVIGWMAAGSELHVELAAPLLMVCAVTQPFFATCIIMKTSMRGAGATHLVMAWSFSTMLFFRVLVLGLLARFTELSLVGVWVVFAVDLLVQSVVFTRLHFAGKWLDARV